MKYPLLFQELNYVTVCLQESIILNGKESGATECETSSSTALVSNEKCSIQKDIVLPNSDPQELHVIVEPESNKETIIIVEDSSSKHVSFLKIIL